MPKRYYRIPLMNWDLKKFSIITFISCMILQEITCQKLCTKLTPSGGMIFRVNETLSNITEPKVVLDMSEKIGELKSNFNLTLVDNPGDYFRLNPSNKQLILQKPIDRDSTDLDELNLKLTCGYTGTDGRQVEGKISVKIIVNDINDNAPQFVNTPYIVNISSSTQIGAIVFSELKAIDLDLNENAQIQYHILAQSGTPKNASSYFTINKSGQVLLKKPLDYRHYNVVIEAGDLPNNRLERQATTTSLVLNVVENDRPPSFLHPSCNSRLFSGVCSFVDYQINIRADVMPGIQPLPVKPKPIEAADLDPPQYPVRYSFANGTPSFYDSYFFIDSQSGAVSQLKPVPNGLTKQFNITVMAKEFGAHSLFSVASLFIIVDDNSVNLHPPVLKASSLQGYIEENSEMGTTVRTGDMANSPPLQILVTDADLKAGMPPATYQYILTGLGASIFAVNQGGYVYLNTPHLDADYLNPLIYQLTIQAREVGTSPVRSSETLTLSIHVIDLNDNAPTFGSQSLEAVAIAEIGQQNIIEVKATDADRGKYGEIFYRLVSVTNHGEPLFRYNRDNGYVVAIAPLPAGEQFQILLEATDGGGRSTQAVIVVDVEKYEGPPYSTPTYGSNTNTNNENSLQFINPSQPSVLYNTVSAEYNVSINESAPVNSVVLSLKNSNPSAIGYAIVRGNEDGRFRIDPNLGSLMTVLPLDREMQAKYRLLVQTINLNMNNTVVVNIDILDENDNSPRILNALPITFAVQEGQPNAFVGQILASDSDLGENGRVTFAIIPPTQKFSIDPKDGILRTVVPLRHSESSTYTLTLVARDNGTIPNEVNTQIVVNVLQNPNQQQQPYFSTSFYNVTVPENSPTGEILRVRAEQIDQNGSPRTYELRQGDPSLFAVDAFTGAVSTLSSLDAELKRFHTIIVGTRQNAQQNLNATATVIVTVSDVNDWVPLFRPFSYSATITDAVAPGTPITQVTAEDNDLDPPNNIVRYQLTGFGQAREYFKIDPISGLISVSSNLQNAPKPDLILLVEAKDGGSPPLSSTATVAVSVRSVLATVEPFLSAPTNQIVTRTETISNLPVQFGVKSFSASVSEAAQPSYFIQILPVDNKPSNTLSIQCNIVSGNFAGAFSVLVNREGNCELRTQTVLDRETVDMYTLNISVSSFSSLSNTQSTDYAEATIFIIDTNDNAPQFQFETEYLGYRMYFGALDINAREFSPILTVKAIDVDVGNNSYVTYSIVSDSPDAKYFQIVPNGEIRNIKVFSTIADKSTMFFQFRVEARDSPSNGLSKTSMADVSINAITNANRFVMVLEGILPDQALKYIPLIKKALHNRTGSCRIIGYESVTESSSLAAEEKPGTEIVWYAIDPTTGLICRRNQFSQLFEEEHISRIRGELDVYFKMQTIRESSPVIVSSSASIFSYDKWQAAEIALIVLACIIAVGAIIGILAMCYFWTRYKASRRTIVPIDKMQLYAALPKYNALLLPPSEKEYEIQTLQMALPDEHDSVKIGEADFSIEEGIYSIQPAGRLDHFVHHPHSRQPPPHVYIPPPDYPLNSNNNSQTSITTNNNRHRFGPANGDKTTIL